jgi:hypothetical protein
LASARRALVLLAVLLSAIGARAGGDDREFSVLLPTGAPAPNTIIDTLVVRPDGSTFAAPVLARRGRGRLSDMLPLLRAELEAPRIHVWLSARAADPMAGTEWALVRGPLPTFPERLVLKRAAAVRLVARRPDGGRIEPAWLDLTPLAGQKGLRLPARRVQASAPGVFEFFIAPDTAYEARLSEVVGYAPPDAVLLGAGASGQHIVLFHEAPWAVVRVVDGKDQPVAGARVRLSTGSEVVADAAGRAILSLSGAAVAADLTVVPPATRPALLIGHWGRKEWRQGNEFVARLGRATPTRGHLVDEAGRPIPGSGVRFRRHFGHMMPDEDEVVRVDAEGAFVLSHLAPGTLEVWPLVPGLVQDTRAGQEAPPLSLRAGRDDVRIVVPTAPTLEVEVTNWSDQQGKLDPLGGIPSTLRLVAERVDGGEAHAPIRAEGTCRFLGLRNRAHYAVWGSWPERGAYLLLRHVTAATKRAKASIVAGREFRVRISPPEAVAPGRELGGSAIVSRGLCVVGSRVPGGGLLWFRGVPPVDVVVRATAIDRSGHVPARVWAGEITVPASTGGNEALSLTLRELPTGGPR